MFVVFVRVYLHFCLTQTISMIEYSYYIGGECPSVSICIALSYRTYILVLLFYLYVYI